MYARGMSLRDIEKQVKEMYDVEMSDSLISRIIDNIYPIVYMDAMVFKIKFWLNIVTELKNRGVKDILIASVDGLKGFSEAINSVFPQTIVQRCIIHQIRYSMKYVGSKYYTTNTVEGFLSFLNKFI